MPKLTIQDLQKLRETAQKATNLREGNTKIKITVHMGTCGIAAGSREIINTVMDLYEKSGLQDVMITTSGCAGLCSREPMATIEIAGKTPVKYVDLTEEKIKEIFKEHIENGNPVAQYALVQGNERTE